MDQTPQIGDHLISRRRWYVHHGIYAGGGRVIHYRGYTRRLTREPIEEVSLEAFAGGHGYEIRAWVAPRYAGADRVARARSRMGERRYRLLSNNCEHFCQWCITGEARSTQVEQWMEWAKRELLSLGARALPRSARPSRSGDEPPLSGGALA
jgi:hypothetical protein